MTAVNALYGAWRNWRTEWGERATLPGLTDPHVAGNTDPVVAFAFSPDGTHVLTGSGDTARLWDAGSGKPIATLSVHTGPISPILALAFSPDGKRVRAATWDKRSWIPGLGGHDDGDLGRRLRQTRCQSANT